jgi:hypothetical protein
MHDHISLIGFVFGSAVIILAGVAAFTFGIVLLLERVFAKAKAASPTLWGHLRSREDHGLVEQSSSSEMEAWHAENQARLEIIKPSQFGSIDQIVKSCDPSDRFRKRE